jgi:MinD-like ATPase involved in chromosome partitioning or flagellar assembly
VTGDDSQSRLLLALTPLAERQIEETLFAAESELHVVASAADAGQLLAHSRQYDADAVLISSDLSGLDARHVSELHARGLRLVGLAVDDNDVETIARLGIDAVLRPPLEPHTLRATLLGEIAEQAIGPAISGNGSSPSSASDGLASVERSGSVIAVIGSAGSPGASECASSLAALAAGRWSTLLVELDLHSGSLDLRLGADPRQGSLLGLVRASRTDSAPAELLERWTQGGQRGWPPVLLAPSTTDASLDELVRPGAIRAALETAASLYPLVVSDVGSLLATPGAIPPTARAHREAILTADAVLLVIGARDEQIRAGRRQLTLLLDELGVKRERLRLLVNGAGAPAAGPRSELDGILANELAELRLAVDGWLPYDARALARTRRSGLPLALARPRGPYARALERLLDELLLPAQPVAKERKQRLPVPTMETPIDEEVALPWRN